MSQPHWQLNENSTRVILTLTAYNDLIPMRKPRKKTTPALAYMRTSSAANVGADKDSEKRQRAAIEAFAKHAGFEIIDWYYDEAVSGADRIEERPGFTDLLRHLEGNGVRTIIVETANRFARDLIVQELGFHALRELGCGLIAADSPNSFLEDTPTAILIRQVLGAVSQFRKAHSSQSSKGLVTASGARRENAKGVRATRKRDRGLWPLPRSFAAPIPRREGVSA